MSGERTAKVIDVSLMADQTQSGEGAIPAGPLSARLVERARSGDRLAFDQIMIEHQRRVVSLAWRILGNQDDALDAAQESFLRVYKHLKGYDPKYEFSAWLSRIVINVCRDLAKKRSRGNPTSFEEGFESGKLAEPVSPNSTEDEVIFAQEQDLVAQALSTLPEKERLAIVLRDLEGFSTERVAQVLGSSPATIRSQISSARSKIKRFRERRLNQSSRSKPSLRDRGMGGPDEL